jgi:hypothetical protein
MKKINTLTLLICLALLASGQEYSRIEDADELEEQSVILTREYPQIFERSEIKDVLLLDDNHSIVRYLKDKVYHETIINSGRKDMLLLETAQFIPKEELPDIIMKAYEDNTKGSPEIVKQFIVHRPDGEQLYRLDLADPNSDDVVTLYFDKMGHPAETAL